MRRATGPKAAGRGVASTAASSSPGAAAPEGPFDRRRAALALLIAAAGLALGLVLPVDDWLLALAGWLRDAGAAGSVTFGAIYVVGTVALFPGSLLTLVAGFVYGPLAGTLIVWPAATLGSVSSFLIGRYVARGWVAARVERMPRLLPIDRAVDRAGPKLVVLLRLSPLVPYNLLNYALGLTRITLLKYTAASAAGMLPGTVLYVYLGSLLTSATRLTAGQDHRGTSILYWLGLVASALAAGLLGRAARRELARGLSIGADPPPPPGTR